MRRGTRRASGTHGFEKALVFLSIHPLVPASVGWGGTLLALDSRAHFESELRIPFTLNDP